MNATHTRTLATLATAGAASAVALAGLRARGLNWGASPDEVAGSFPGDEFVHDENYRRTMAITIDALPENVFPWLAQLGQGRGGLYSYDFLDRLFGILDGPSAQEILPEFQDLKVGDVVPAGKTPAFPVAAVERDRHLVLAGADAEVTWRWAFNLVPMPGGHTRLLTRFGGHMPTGLRYRLALPLIDLAAFIMTRKMLLNLRTRAERQAHPRRGAEVCHL
ncbi:MAG: SRPBCC family protein [Tepidiformaceae bacterium]